MEATTQEKPTIKDLDYRIKLATLLRQHMNIAFCCTDPDKVREQIKWAERQAEDDSVSVDILWMPEQAFLDRIKEGGI